MQITRFQRIRNHRIFRDFSWPATGLPDFGKFNLIYGWNGSGKTTLSNLFRHLQNRTAVDEGEVTVVVDGRSVTQDAIPTAALPQVRVFNRDAVNRNVFELAGEELPPVYYLGEDSIETQKKIEKLKTDQQDNLLAIAVSQTEKRDSESDLERFCSDQAKAIKNLLTAPGGGPYNNYNSALFKRTVERLLGSGGGARLSTEDKKRHLAIKGESARAKIPIPTAAYPNFADFVRRVGDALSQSIVSNSLAELVSNPELSSWVEQGLGLHRGGNTTDVCRFCAQPLSATRVAQLEGHFNDQYQRLQSELSNLITEVDGYQVSVKAIQVPDKNLLYSHLISEYEQSVVTMNRQSGLVGSLLAVVRRALMAKKGEPFRNLDLMTFFTNLAPSDSPAGGWEKFFQVLLAAGTGISAVVGKTSFDRACQLIGDHNKQSDRFVDELKSARQALEEDAVIEVLEDYRAKSERVAKASNSASQAEKAKRELAAKITELERTIRRHQPAAAELNEDMRTYLGRDELRFETKDTGYSITRNGQPALNLSEGERTAIAFMYFLKSLQDTGFDLRHGVVVIDDPVSSLDANSLYCAFGFMKARIQQAQQLFVLTHNFTFFRQVKNWFNHIDNIRGTKRPDLQKLKDVRFYMLRTDAPAGERRASLRVLDDLLHRFESEYHHLFQTVFEASEFPDDTPLNQFYALPNSSRRLLEAVLAFKQPERAGELHQQLQAIQFDEAKKARIIRFINTYSHHGLIAEPSHDLSILHETPQILRDVLALIQHLDPEHFANMKVLCESANEDEHAATDGT
ncbi:MAG: AAA family ATPase [Sterolibacterium sp.]